MHSVTKGNQVIHLVKLLAIFFTVFVSFDVLAKDDADPIGNRMCFMIAMLQYNVTRIIGMIAIMGLGVLALKGKLSWVVSLMIVVGIIITFQAPNIVNMVSGDISKRCNADDWTGYGADDVIGHRLCQILKLFRSNTVRAIAVVGIMILGMQALKGSLSWTVALMSVVGIILLFAAPNIYISIVGQNSYQQNCYGIGDKNK